MEHLEGILVSRNEHINTSAVGADKDGSNLFLRIYSQSNTFSNLSKNDRFTFSLTDDPELFYRGALIGHNNDIQELPDDELRMDGEYISPRGAAKVFFCTILDREIKTERDEYGDADILSIKAEATKIKGVGAHIQRDNPYVEALVYASRYNIASSEQKNKIMKHVRKILKNKEDNLSQRILDHVGVVDG